MQQDRRKGFAEAHRVPHGCHGLPASFTSSSSKFLRDSCNRVREPIRIFIDSIPPPSPPPEICDEIGELQIGGGEPEEETEEMKDETPASRNHRHRPWARKVISAHWKNAAVWVFDLPILHHILRFTFRHLCLTCAISWLAG